MKFEEISAAWEEDGKIDRSELSNASMDIPLLHNKYFKIFSKERYKLKTMELELKSLKMAKFEFYTQGPNEETPPTWKLPAIGRIIKSDAQQYVDTDPDVVQMNLRIFAQSEKVDYLESIIKMIINRGYQIKSIIDWEKFRNGV